MRTAPWTTIGAATLLLASSCARPVPPRPRNLVIVTLDTTHADRLPMYGFASIETPAIDALARESVVFDQAMSVATHNAFTAHSSLFTGLYPPHHGIRDDADRPLGPDKTTIAEVLHARGFRTGAFVGSTVLAADARALARLRHAQRGCVHGRQGAAASPRQRGNRWRASVARLVTRRALLRVGASCCRRACSADSAGLVPPKCTAISTPAASRSPTRSSAG